MVKTMTDIQEPLAPAKRLLAGYIHEDEMAKARDVHVRALRVERQRGDGPPYIKFLGKFITPRPAR